MKPSRRVISGLDAAWLWLPKPDGAVREGATGQFGLWVPEDPDSLLDQMTQEDFDNTDERMPYFGTIWPSAESLVPWILDGPALDGRQVLDLGCGLGPCGFAAARRGASVTFFDWEQRALEFVSASADEQGLPADRFNFVVGDWRRAPEVGPFDVILAADVLYEERNGPAVAAFVAQALHPGGEAWIGDPGRKYAQSFPEMARVAGLTPLSEALLPPQPHGITVKLLRFRGEAALP